MGHWLADIKLDPFDGNRAIYGTGYGLWLTHNLDAAHKGGTSASACCGLRPPVAMTWRRLAPSM